VDYIKILRGKWKGLYNSSGRSFPEVDDQGWNYVVVDKSTATLELGDLYICGTRNA
jgi:hypothetical protein